MTDLIQMDLTIPQVDMSSLLSLEAKAQEPLWGPTGLDVYERTYQRVKADGTKETWSDTVRRVVKGNLSLVPGDRTFPGEEEELYDLFYSFRAIPGGRHLWMSGVEGRQFLFNCYVSGWGSNLSDHFAFTFNQLMEGGGVGANYSNKYLDHYTIFNLVRVHIVCSPEHENYKDLLEAGLLSSEFSSEYQGAWEIEDSREGWVFALRETIDKATAFEPKGFEQDSSTAQYNVSLVYDVSNIRPAGKRIKTFGGTSAGPVPFAKMMKAIAHRLNDGWQDGFSGPLAMEMDHEIATCVVSGNVRRSARMSQMHWKDPNIFWFLRCKEDSLGHWSTNISVEIDGEFIDSLQKFDSRAAQVYQEIVRGMLTNGEPGIWNSEYSNLHEPNKIVATNPCGEIALEPWENCNLGHINLDSFVRTDGSIDYDGCARAHKLMARFLIRATFGDISDPKTKDVVLRNRRIGLGHFGYAGFVAKQEILFSESWKIPAIIAFLKDMKAEVDDACTKYCHELRIPVPVKNTTVAPTGTIAKLAGRTEGIHPAFARYFIRRIRYSTIDESQRQRLEEYVAQGFRVVEDPMVPNTMVVEIPTKEALVEELEKLGIHEGYLQSADEIGFKDMLEVQAMYQTYWADNAVSFTVNIDPQVFTENSLARMLMPYLSILKGTTIFPEKSFVLPPYERVTKETYDALWASQGGLTMVSDGVDESCMNGACPVR